MKLGKERFIKSIRFSTLEKIYYNLLNVIKLIENEPITKKILIDNDVALYGIFDINTLEWEKEKVHCVENYKKDDHIFFTKSELLQGEYKINNQVLNEELINEYIYTSVEYNNHMRSVVLTAKEDFQLEYDTFKEVITDKKQLYDLLEDIKTTYETKVEEKLKNLQEIKKGLENFKK